MRQFIIFFVTICSLPFSASFSAADRPDGAVEKHVQRAEALFHNNQHFSAVNEYKKAVSLGYNSADVFRKLGLLYYELGFPDEAAGNLEKAVSLAPDLVFLKIELGIVYFSRGKLDNAADQFISALVKNPGLSSAYYYLGEIYFRKKKYDAAWLSLKNAECLGYSNIELIKKIELLSPPPQIVPCKYEGEDLYIRQIMVKTNLQAEEVLQRLSEGELFEDIAAEYDKSGSSATGGFIGRFRPTDLHPRIAEALLAGQVFSPPAVVQTGSDVLILQRIVPFNYNDWKKGLENNTNAKKDLDEKVTAVKETMTVPVPVYMIADADNSITSTQAKDIYIVYAGSYRYMRAAKELVNELASRGYPAYHYEETTETKGTLHVVIAGKYESFSKAKEAAENLSQHGYEYFIYPKKIAP